MPPPPLAHPAALLWFKRRWAAASGAFAALDAAGPGTGESGGGGSLSRLRAQLAQSVVTLFLKR